MKICKIIILVLVTIVLITAAFYVRHLINEHNKEMDRLQAEYEERHDFSKYTGGAENDQQANNQPGHISWNGVPLSSMYSYLSEGKKYFHVSEFVPTDESLAQGAIIRIQDDGQEYVKHVFLNNDQYNIKLMDPKTKFEYVEIEKLATTKAGIFFRSNSEDDGTYFIKEMIYGNEISQYYDLKEDNSVYSKDSKTLYSVFPEIEGEYTIQDGTSCIGFEAFLFCKSITNIIIPNSVTSIEKYAFKCCSSLESIVIPEGVTTIEPQTFLGCENMKYIELPSTITEIKENAFYDCNAVIRYRGTEEQWEAINIQQQGWNNKEENNPQIIFNYISVN